jgi:peptidoglycan/xylan/chitin deacetylase (PgdA/CDA1 family)
VTLGHRIATLVLLTAYALAAAFVARPLLVTPSAARAAAGSTGAPAGKTTGSPVHEPPAVDPSPTRTAAPIVWIRAATRHPATPSLPAPATPTVTAAPTRVPPPTPIPPPVHVLRTCPIDGDTDLLPPAPVHIVFDQPMDADPAALSVAITPDLPFSVEWIAPEHLLLRTAPRQPGTEYQLTLSTARSRKGGSLAQPLSLTFGQGGLGAPIPILMYHRVQPLEDDVWEAIREWTVSPMQLASHLDLLASLGANVVPLGQVVDYLRGGEPLPERPAVLTFDDGYRSAFLNAVPLLQARELPATFFIVPAYVGSAAYMDWDQVRGLTAAGFDVGAHGYDHVRTDNLGKVQAERQFGESRRVLEEQTGGEVIAFAYPYGYYSTWGMRQLASYGYGAAVTTDPMVYQKPGRLLNLGRIYVGYGEPLEKLRDMLPWD